MEHRQFGRTGVKVSVLCLGCMNFGGPTPEDESIKMIDHAINAGINFLDTANVYNRGVSESVVGKALKQNGKRDTIFLATKVHGRMGDDINDMGNNRRHIIAQCDESLRRLQTDYIDLYQIHRPHSDTPIDETLRALDDLIRAGKVRYIGTSTFGSWQVVDALWASKELGLNRFVSEQPPYHLLDRTIEREMVPMAQTYGIAIIPWSPLARGFLTGKYERGQDLPADSRFSREMGGTRGAAFEERAKKHFSDLAYGVLDVLKELAQEKNASISQIALAWCAHQPAITSPIIGPRTMAHLVDNLTAADVTITDEDCARLDTVAQPESAIVPYYHGSMIDLKAPQYHRR